MEIPANVLPKQSLHPTIAERVWPNFIRGEYDTAVFQAFKEVEVAVRAAGGFATTDTSWGRRLTSIRVRSLTQRYRKRRSEQC